MSASTFPQYRRRVAIPVRYWLIQHFEQQHRKPNRSNQSKWVTRRRGLVSQNLRGFTSVALSRLVPQLATVIPQHEGWSVPHATRTLRSDRFFAITNALRYVSKAFALPNPTSSAYSVTLLRPT